MSNGLQTSLNAFRAAMADLRRLLDTGDYVARPERLLDVAGAAWLASAEIESAAERMLEASPDAPNAMAGHSGVQAAKQDGGPNLLDKLSPECLAIALKVLDPTITVAQVAAAVGVCRTTPYRWERFVAVDAASCRPALLQPKMTAPAVSCVASEI